MSRRKPVFSDAEDGGWGIKARRGSSAELDITPMIDVTFLLLIFFMVTSTMRPTSELQLPIAKHGVGVPADDAVIVQILSPGVAGGGDPEVLLDKSPVTLEELEQRVQESYDANRSEVIIQADRDTPHRAVLQVMNAIKSVDGVKFHVGVRDEPQY